MSEGHHGTGRREPDLVPEDDAVIGRAFRLSMAVIAVVLAGAALAVFLIYRPAGEDAAPRDAGPRVRGQERPRTAAAPAVRFTDITTAAGIDFVHVNGARGDKLLPETMGGGGAFFDYDADGDQDLLLVNSSHWLDSMPAGRPRPTTMLYRNDGTGTFENVTSAAGLGVEAYGMGVAVGDYDNDGAVDVFITAVGGNSLFRNVGGQFYDVTREGGVRGDPAEWSTSAAFVDHDNDGDLDLFVGNYVRWSKAIDFEVGFQLTGLGRAYGPPVAFEGSHPYLYENVGDGTFRDVSATAGVQVLNPATGAPLAKTLGVLPIDADRDGWIDVFVANDTVQNLFFHNQGNGTFAEQAVTLGVAFDRNGAATGAMGVDAAYFRDDGALGVAIGNFANEMTSLYVAQGGPMLYADEAIGTGVGAISRLAVTFGLFFFDYDLDGRLDLLQVNGHLEEAINQVQSSQHYEQTAQLFWNAGPDAVRTYVPVASDSMGDLAAPVVGRGASFADIDGDGDLDVLITQIGRRPLLLRNEQALGHHWLRVQLVGRSVNRDGIGAWIELTSRGVTQRRHVMPSRSYLSQVELPVTFGLGGSREIEALRVHWPGGVAQDVDGVPDVAVDSTIIVEQARR
jgi:hypothetical protein